MAPEPVKRNGFGLILKCFHELREHTVGLKRIRVVPLSSHVLR